MATDIYTQLPPDSTVNKNKVRVLQLTPPAGVAGGDGITTVVQEVVGLADDDGYLLTSGGAGGKKLAVELQREMLEELRTLNRGIAHLVMVCMAGMRPHRPLPQADAWLTRVLGKEGSVGR